MLPEVNRLSCLETTMARFTDSIIIIYRTKSKRGERVERFVLECRHECCDWIGRDTGMLSGAMGSAFGGLCNGNCGVCNFDRSIVASLSQHGQNPASS